MPHLELVHPEIKAEKIEPEIPQDILKQNATLPSQSRQTKQKETSLPNVPIAPTRDFQKVPNSITKSAIPEGGQTGQIENALRCALQPNAGRH